MKSETVTWPDAQPKGIFFFLSFLNVSSPNQIQPPPKKKFLLLSLLVVCVPKRSLMQDEFEVIFYMRKLQMKEMSLKQFHLSANGASLRFNRR